MNMTEQKERKIRQTVIGTVVSNKMKDTVVVARKVYVMHPKYGKQQEKRVKMHVHDRGNSCGVGDLVEVQSVRPMSRTKRWRIVRIVEKAK
jgi:small subunit ribosomal protein S17